MVAFGSIRLLQFSHAQVLWQLSLFRPFWQSSCTQLLVSAFAFRSLPTCTSQVFVFAVLSHTIAFRSIRLSQFSRIRVLWQHSLFFRPFLAVFRHSCLCQPSLFAAFPSALHTSLFSQSSCIRSLLAAFASCSFLTHGLFGSIRSSSAFFGSLPAHSCLCQPSLSQPFHLHFTRLCFHSLLAYGCFWQLEHSPLAVFSRTGASAAFAPLPPFWQSSCTQLLVSAFAFHSLPTRASYAHQSASLGPIPQYTNCASPTSHLHGTEPPRIGKHHSYDYGLRRCRISHPGHRGPPPSEPMAKSPTHLHASLKTRLWLNCLHILLLTGRNFGSTAYASLRFSQDKTLAKSPTHLHASLRK